MKKRKIIDNTRYFKANAARKQEHDDQLARELALRRLHEVWETWRKRVVIQSRKIEELPVLLNELVWLSQQALTGLNTEIAKVMLENFTKMVDVDIAKTFKFVQINEMMITVLADCPHYRPKVIGVDPDDGPNMYECGWGGQVYLPRHQFDSNTFNFKCPQCQNPLSTDDMIPANTNVVNKGNVAIKFRPAHDRGAKVIDKDIFHFLNTDQLLAFNWVNLHAQKDGFERFALDGQNLVVINNGLQHRIGAIKHPEAVNLPPLNPPAPADGPAPEASLPQA